MENKKISEQIEIGSRMDFAKIAFALAIVSVIGIVFIQYEAMQEATKFSMSMNGSIRITVVNAINDGAVKNYDNWMYLRNYAIGFTSFFAGVGYALRKRALNLQNK